MGLPKSRENVFRKMRTDDTLRTINAIQVHSEQKIKEGFEGKATRNVNARVKVLGPWCDEIFYSFIGISNSESPLHEKLRN